MHSVAKFGLIAAILLGGLSTPWMAQAVPASSTPDAAAPRRNVRLWNTFQQAEVLPGNNVMVTVGVRNISKTTIHDLRIHLSFQPEEVQPTYNLPKAGMLLSEQVQWDIPYIYAGQSWTVTFPVTVNDAVQMGDEIQVTARLSGEELTASSTVTQTASIGVAGLPATGQHVAEYIALALATLAAFLSILSICRRRYVALTAQR